jgi:energy-coupling factor transporter ATP-binding protein EcfA2
MNSTSNGFHMIRSIDIKNFRCYEHLHIDDCKRINVIVGDNGSGKTTLLEAIFMTLATGTEIALRLRRQRGLDGSFQGTAAKIEQAFWKDFFHDGDLNIPVQITLKGDGPETRSLQLSRTFIEEVRSLDGKSAETIISGPVAFTWQPYRGKERIVVPRIGPGNAIHLPETGEDHPNFFHFAASHPTSSIESADRFSELSKEGRHLDFVEAFKKQYTHIYDMGIEVIAGAPAIFVSLEGGTRKIPLTNLSGSVNKVVAILLALYTERRSVVTVDEIEDGIYYKNLEHVWKQLIFASRKNEAQLFVTTHSMECLRALVKAAGKKFDDLALWRLERGDQGPPELLAFDGEALVAGIKHKIEVRGSADETDN